MKTSNNKFSITALFLIIFGVFFIGIVIVAGIIFFNEKTIVVPDDELTIQDAVDEASPGDIILVKASGGPYNEEVTITTDNIKLIGIGKVKPVIDGTVLGFVSGITIDNTSGVLVKNFVVQNFGEDGIFLISSPNNLIKGNNVIENGREGIFLTSSSNNMIKGNKSNGNENSGIFLDDSDNSMIRGNKSNENGFEGIFLDGSDNNLIKGNKSNDNNLDGILLSVSSNGNDIFFNRAFGNGDGITFFDINDQGTNNFKGNKCDTSFPVGICD